MAVDQTESQALGDLAARQLANATKTVPQLGTSVFWISAANSTSRLTTSCRSWCLNRRLFSMATAMTLLMVVTNCTLL